MGDRVFDMVESLHRKARRHQPKYRFNGKTKSDFEKWKKALKAEILQIMGPMPEPVDLNPEIEWELLEDGIIKRRVILDLEQDMSVEALVYIPQKSSDRKNPAILCNHGHGTYGKDSVMGVRIAGEKDRDFEIDRHNYDYGLQMAKHGYVTMAIDYRTFGERADNVLPRSGRRDPCNVHFIRGSILGYNLLTLDIFDATRAIDYLCGLDCVDPERIGTMGLSFGGTMTTWISLFDDRIKAADIICYSCLFETFAMKKANFCGSQMLPGLYALADIPDLHGLSAPKPLLVEIGVHDKCFTPDESIDCSREVVKIYEAAGALENFETDIFEDGHKFGGNKAFDFFDKHLKGA
jgi:dienelactone hydrolase